MHDSTTSTRATSRTPPRNPTPTTAPALVPDTIGSWRITGETPSVPAVPLSVFCLSPEPPAPCNRLDGARDLGGYGSSDEFLRVKVHLSPLSFTDAQFATNLATASAAGVGRTTAATAAGRPAWIVEGSTRSGVFRFLATRLSDTAYVLFLQSCGFAACRSSFPLDHAQSPAGRSRPDTNHDEVGALARRSGRRVPTGACAVRRPSVRSEGAVPQPHRVLPDRRAGHHANADPRLQFALHERTSLSGGQQVAGFRTP